MTDTAGTDPSDRVLDAALPHVPFDGWSDRTLDRAIRDSGVDRGVALSLFPNGPVDLALAYHRRGDRAMVAALKAMDPAQMRFRDRVAAAVRLRLEAADREAVRRGSTLFALPQNMGHGMLALWQTADAIWDALGDRSEDVNWYTKRGLLTGVYGSTTLFWLGDDSPGHRDTWAFLDRRIDDVMQVEKVKAQVNANPALRGLMAGPAWLVARIRRPVRMSDMAVPGLWPAPPPPPTPTPTPPPTPPGAMSATPGPPPSPGSTAHAGGDAI